MKNSNSKNKPIEKKTNRRIPSARVAILGNPNSGKTALFNRLTGMHQKTGNFPGVTVEKKTGYLKNQPILLEDYPGSYSLQAETQDEQIVSDFVQSWRHQHNRPDAVVIVVDATHLDRNIFFALQILDWGLPAVVVLNMYDEVKRKKRVIDSDLLAKLLVAEAVIPASAKSGEGIDEIIRTVSSLALEKRPAAGRQPLIKADAQLTLVGEMTDFLARFYQDRNILPLIDSLRILADDRYAKHVMPFLDKKQVADLNDLTKRTRDRFDSQNIDYHSLETSARYRFIDEELRPAFERSMESEKSMSEKVDRVITHPVLGSIIFLVLLTFIFNAIFSWAQYPMGLIEDLFSQLGNFLTNTLPPSKIKGLLVDGMIGGVGNIVVFLPQIILLVFFISILEDSGYMSRMSFMMDGLMRRFGLSGKSVLPLLSGFACAIPAVMAARTIERWRDRLLIIMLIPLMSCSARLPVYTLVISALIPQKTFWGFLELQGMILLGVYFLGFFTALIVAMVVKFVAGTSRLAQYLFELPPYRFPIFRSVGWRVYDAGKKFLLNAGSIILAMTVILWFLASYPDPDPGENLSSKDAVSQSYAGQLGHLIEPVISPLGFDWKIGVGLISSFAAREVIISTFSTIYNIEAGDEAPVVSLAQAMKNDRRPDGRPLFTPLVALSLLIFFVYAAQCMSTFAIIRRETQSWRWPLIMILYLNLLAYFASLIVYQGGKLIGFEG